MEMTQRGRLDHEQRERLRASMHEAEETRKELARHRATVVKFVEASSFREVSELTGISTTTLQRWKREAGK